MNTALQTLSGPARVARRSTRASHGAWAYLAVAALAAILLALIVWPIGTLLYGTVSKAPPQEMVFSVENFTLRNFEVLASSATVAGAAFNSIVTAAIGAVVAMVIALLFVWAIGRTNVPLKGMIAIAAIMPLFVSELVAGIAWSRLGFSYSGLINIALRDLGIPLSVDMGTVPGIAFVLGLYYAPYAYLLMIAAFRNLDPSLEEAAFTCGASTFYTMRRIVLPLMSYAIVSAALMVFVTLLSSYGIPFILGSINQLNFLTTFIYRLIHSAPTDYQLATTVGVLITIVTLIGVLAQNRLFANRNLTTISGRLYQPRTLDIGRWRYVVLALALAYLFVAVVIPYLVLILTAFRQVQFFARFVDVLNPLTLTVANFERAFANPEIVHSVVNTLIVAFCLAVSGVALCLTLGYVIERTQLPGRSLLQAVASVPVAIPSLIISVGFLWAWISTPVYGTIWILVLAFVSRHVPDGLRPVSAALRQIHRELEEAAQICGASWGRTFRRIVAPLVRGGLLSLVILLVIYAVRELGPILFLTNSETRTMAVQVLESWEQGDVAGAVVVALIQSVILLSVLLVGRFVFRVSVTP